MFRAQIAGDEDSLQILHKNFGEYILFEDNEYFLICPQFQNMGTDNLFSFAEKKLQHMLFILNLKINEECNVKLGAIENVKNDGKKDIYLKADPIIVKSKVYAKCTVINKNGEIIDSDKSSEDLKPYLECINKNDSINNVLEYFNEINSSNLSFNLYNIIEVIGKDIGRKNDIPKHFNAISKNKFSNLTYTLNYGMEKKSRHHPESPIKDKILPEEEIKRLVKSIIIEWMSKKLDDFKSSQ